MARLLRPTQETQVWCLLGPTPPPRLLPVLRVGLLAAGAGDGQNGQPAEAAARTQGRLAERCAAGRRRFMPAPRHGGSGARPTARRLGAPPQSVPPAGVGPAPRVARTAPSPP